MPRPTLAADAPVLITAPDHALVAPAIEYLSRLGVPASEIRRLSVHCPAGEPMTLEVELIVREVPDA